MGIIFSAAAEVTTCYNRKFDVINNIVFVFFLCLVFSLEITTEI